jgi:hypothetical protein
MVRLSADGLTLLRFFNDPTHAPAVGVAVS